MLQNYIAQRMAPARVAQDGRRAAQYGVLEKKKRERCDVRAADEARGGREIGEAQPATGWPKRPRLHQSRVLRVLSAAVCLQEATRFLTIDGVPPVATARPSLWPVGLEPATRATVCPFLACRERPLRVTMAEHNPSRGPCRRSALLHGQKDIGRRQRRKCPLLDWPTPYR